MIKYMKNLEPVKILIFANILNLSRRGVTNKYVFLEILWSLDLTIKYSLHDLDDLARLSILHHLWVNSQ